MPSEERRITFDYDELYRAVFTLCVKRDLHKPPPGVIDHVSASADDEDMIVVKIVNKQKGTSSKNGYSRDFLAAALMNYCRACHIPLPKKGTKSLELGPATIVLCIAM